MISDQSKCRLFTAQIKERNASCYTAIDETNDLWHCAATNLLRHYFHSLYSVHVKYYGAPNRTKALGDEGDLQVLRRGYVGPTTRV